MNARGELTQIAHPRLHVLERLLRRHIRLVGVFAEDRAGAPASGSSPLRRALVGRRHADRARAGGAPRRRPRRSGRARRPAVRARRRSRSEAVTSSAKSASRFSAPSGKACGRVLDAMMPPQVLPATVTGAPSADPMPTARSLFTSSPRTSVSRRPSVCRPPQRPRDRFPVDRDPLTRLELGRAAGRPEAHDRPGPVVLEANDSRRSAPRHRPTSSQTPSNNRAGTRSLATSVATRRSAACSASSASSCTAWAASSPTSPAPPATPCLCWRTTAGVPGSRYRQARVVRRIVAASRSAPRVAERRYALGFCHAARRCALPRRCRWLDSLVALENLRARG